MMLVVGVDPARRSASALHLAMMLARSADAQVVVVAVLPHTWTAATGNVDAEWRRYTRDAANLALDHAAAVLGEALDADYLVHEAQSVRGGILEVARQREADLIVLGSGAEGASGRVAIGADADAVLHASSIPVVIAPRGFRAADDAVVGRVTGAIRGAEATQGFVRSVAEIAVQLGAALRLASFAVVPRDSGTSGAGRDVGARIADEWSRESDSKMTRLLSQLTHGQRIRHREAVVVGRGATWESAVGDVGWRDDEILVVGSSSGGALSKVFLGSRAATIARNSPVPVLVLPRERG